MAVHLQHAIRRLFSFARVHLVYGSLIYLNELQLEVVASAAGDGYDRVFDFGGYGLVYHEDGHVVERCHAHMLRLLLHVSDDWLSGL